MLCQPLELESISPFLPPLCPSPVTCSMPRPPTCLHLCHLPLSGTPLPPHPLMGEACCLPRVRLPSDTLHRNTPTAAHKNTLPGIHQGPRSGGLLASRLLADTSAGGELAVRDRHDGALRTGAEEPKPFRALPPVRINVSRMLYGTIEFFKTRREKCADKIFMRFLLELTCFSQ